MSVWSDKLGYSSVLFSALLGSLFIILIVSVMLIYSHDALVQAGTQLFTLNWHPARGQFGVLPMLYGSAMVTLIAMLIATPLGLFAAIFTAEMLSARTRYYVKALLELLAGIPSIIYGLLGIAFLGVWIGNLFDLPSGRVILTGGIILAIMVLPTLITLTDDALRHVPDHYREAGKALGLYRYQVTARAVLPAARADIAGAILLALGRALGETMAVMLVIGSIDKIPKPFINVLAPGQTITSKLGREIAETAFGSLHFSAMIFMGLILLAGVLLLTALSLHYFNPEQRLYE